MFEHALRLLPSAQIEILVSPLRVPLTCPYTRPTPEGLPSMPIPYTAMSGVYTIFLSILLLGTTCLPFSDLGIDKSRK